MTKGKQYPGWKERGYKDTRNRNQRRFFPLEKTDTTIMLMNRARTRLAKIRGVPDTQKDLPDAEVMREALREYVGK